ncbi:MAG: type II toxin-antitoxin system PemK/MazF family toxin [Acidobacteriota bacterium]
MKRGDVWEADLGGKAGKRPVIVLTRSAVIPHLNKVTVAEITTQGKGYPTEVDIDQQANLPLHSFVQLDNIQTIPKLKLRS